MTINFGGKELKIKYGYKATLKTRLLSRIAKKETATGELSDMEDMLLFLPEVLLVGLQKYHADEYGFDFENEDEKKAQIEKMFPIIEEYCDGDGVDAITLYQNLVEEMTKNGFLKVVLSQSVAAEQDKKMKRVK